MAYEAKSQEFLVQELVDRVESLKTEIKDLKSRLSALESELEAKDHEKMIALKRQQAYIKELKKLAQEERRRADVAERIRDGVISVGSLNGERTEEEKSVSSMSVLESDNHELILRLSDLQKSHGDLLQKTRHLEAVNTDLERENREKNEVIEHWIRSRPMATVASPINSASSFNPNNRSLGGLRKLFDATMAAVSVSPRGEAAQQDMIEMNKKLQRLLEETLSKNLILQRDLQTLLERTEM